MATPFDSWTIDDVEEAIDAELERTARHFAQGRVGQDAMTSTSRTNPIEVSRAFVEGNHWQGGDGWIGPMPQPEETGFDLTMQALEQGFTSRNVIGEVVERHGDGVASREPHWTLTPRRPLEEGDEPTAEEQSLIDEAEAALTEWWDKRKAHAAVRTLASRVCWAERAAVRLYVPRGMVDRMPDGPAGGKILTAESLEDALSLLYIDLPEYDQAIVVVDPDSQSVCGIVMYETGVDARGEGEPTRIAELTYMDGDVTVIRTVSEEDGDGQRFVMDLGKRLTTYEIRRRLLITRQVQQAQRALNLAISMLPRNVVTGGFLERVLLNAQMPGEWEVDKGGNPVKFKPGQYETGSGTTNFVVGVETKDAEGRQQILTPDIKWRDPVDPKAAISAAAQHYHDMLNECDQAHILQVTDGRIGWKSREQARKDYEASLGKTVAELEPCGRWLIETPLAFAEAVMRNARARWTGKLRATFKCRVDRGPVDAPERVAIAADVKSGNFSRQTGMSLLGIDDPDAEMTAIAAQAGGDIALIERQVPLIVQLATVTTIEAAAVFVGVDPKIAAKLGQAIDNMTQDGAPGAPGGGAPNEPPIGGNGRAPNAKPPGQGVPALPNNPRASVGGAG